ncbi:MAG: hypothetical protein U0T83_00350 [Bacteriovoracaceae bacterium]
MSNFDQEFKKFINKDNKVPDELNDSTITHILAELNPSLFSLLTKLILIQIISGIFILSFCPQLGVGFFPNSHFAHILMSFGEFYCNLICGAFFVGTSMLLSTFIFNFDELRVLKRNKIISTGTISLISLVGFHFLGAQFELVIFASWFLGAIISGILGIEIGGALKKMV